MGAVALTPSQILAELRDPNYPHHGQRLVRTSVTVGLARNLLDRYGSNRRPLRLDRVAEIARRIKHPDPEGNMYEEIYVDANGVTRGGQHLLNAVIQAGSEADGVWVWLNWTPATSDFGPGS